MPDRAEARDFALPAGRVRAELRGAADAPLAILVPGLSANLRSFEAMAPRLAAEGRRVVAVDLRGRGLSEATPPGSYGWPAHAADLLALADQLGADRFALVGWSMGAFVALALAARAPGRVERVALIDAVVSSVPGIVETVIRASVDRLDAVHPSVEAYLELARGQGVVTPWSERWDDYFRYELAPVAGGVSARSSRAAVIEDMEWGLDHDPRGYWPALTMPVLLLRALRPIIPRGGDVIPAAVRDEFLAAVPGARLVEVDANHYGIGMDEATASSVADFLSGR